eukprot:2981432-Prymnesium_polylepis.1
MANLASSLELRPDPPDVTPPSPLKKWAIACTASGSGKAADATMLDRTVSGAAFGPCWRAREQAVRGSCRLALHRDGKA